MLKTKQEIVENWLPRYTRRSLEEFDEYILLTNFNKYVINFAQKFGVDVIWQDANMISASANGITIINFGMGSPNAAIIMDLLGAVKPKGCLFLGKGAYGVVDLSEGTEVIVKPRGSSGTADPLDQRSTVGWKGVHAAAILYDEYMLRVECGSSYSSEDKAN